MSDTSTDRIKNLCGEVRKARDDNALSHRKTRKWYKNRAEQLAAILLQVVDERDELKKVVDDGRGNVRTP